MRQGDAALMGIPSDFDSHDTVSINNNYAP